MGNRGVGIRTKFSLFVTFLLAIVLAITSYIFLRHEQAALERALIGRGSALAGYFAASCEEWLATDDDIGLFTTLRAIEREEGITDALVVGPDGAMRAHRDPARLGQEWQPPPSRPIEERKPVTIRQLEGDVDDYLLTAPVTERGTNRELGTVVLRLSREVIQEALRRGQRSALLLLAGSLACGLVGAIILVTVILRPVGLLTRGAEAIGRGDLSSRIAVVSRDEIGSLAATFNDMAAKLEIAQLERIEREKVAQELRIAHQIQEALLPSGGPNVEGLDVTSYYKAAMEVGGDYYDFTEPLRGRLGVIVADVSGKGVPGSLVMTMVRSVMRSNAGDTISPREVLARTNRMIIDDMKPGMFVTAQYCIFDIAAREFHLASAGHNGLILIPAGAERGTVLTPKGMALGLDRGLIFDNLMEEDRQGFGDSDLFFMYTDGVTEAMSPRDEEFGEERLVRFLEDNRSLSSRELSAELNRVLESFMAGARQHDDITYVVVKVQRGAA